MSIAKAAVIQLRSGGDVAQNLARIDAQLEQAAAQGAALALLPENCGHFGARERDKLAVAATQRKDLPPDTLYETLYRASGAKTP